MQLGLRIRELRETIGMTQGQLAASATVSQGYLSQLENGDVRNPSAAVLLRVASAMNVEADELFEAAGYPTVRAMRQLYDDFKAKIDPDLLRYLERLSHDKQRRLLFLLEGMENLIKIDRAEGRTQAALASPIEEAPAIQEAPEIEEASAKEDVRVPTLEVKTPR